MFCLKSLHQWEAKKKVEAVARALSPALAHERALINGAIWWYSQHDPPDRNKMCEERTTWKDFVPPACLPPPVNPFPRSPPPVRLASCEEDTLWVAGMGYGRMAEAGSLIRTHLRAGGRIVAEFLALLAVHSGKQQVESKKENGRILGAWEFVATFSFHLFG